MMTNLLPSGYTQLSYIQSDNSGQYIDSGCSVDDLTSEFEMRIKLSHLNGSGNTSVKGYMGCNNIGTIISYNTNFGIGSTTQGYPYTADGYYDITIVRDENRVSHYNVNGMIFNENAENFDGTLNFGIFKLSPFGQNYLRLFGRCYGFIWKKNGNVERNLIPAIRNSDQEIGMWDTVTKTFFTNAGNGSFVGA